MVEYNLDTVFSSLADPTRRDIVKRTIERDQTISELAERYSMSFAGVAKHLNVLENAQLVAKRKEGRQQIVSARKETIKFASEHLKQYENLWSERYDRLENLLNKEG